MKIDIYNLPTDKLAQLFGVDLDTLKVTEQQLFALFEFEHWATDGEAWIHWSTIEMDTFCFKELDFLLDNHFLKLHKDKPPKYDDWRDRFPPRKYSLMVRAIIVLREPGRYVIDKQEG